MVHWGVEEEEANKHCQIDYPSGDIDSELHEQLQMPMPTFLELSSMMLDYTELAIKGVKVASGNLPCSQWFHGSGFSW